MDPGFLNQGFRVMQSSEAQAMHRVESLDAWDKALGLVFDSNELS